MTSRIATLPGASSDAVVSVGRASSSPAAANKRVVELIWSELVNGGRLEKLDDLVNSNFAERCPLPGLAADIGGLRDRLQLLHRAFPDFHSKILHLIAEDDKVVAYVESTGTHKATFLGLPPSGRRFTIQEVQIFRIVDGKMAEHWQVADFYALLQQLGFAGSSAISF